MLHKVAKLEDMAEEGMMTVEVVGQEITLCRTEGKVYAVQRRCGHMAAPLEMGNLNGTILICPLHYARFDVRTGEVLSGPVPSAPPGGPPPTERQRFMVQVESKVKTMPLKTYKVQVKGADIFVEI